VTNIGDGKVVMANMLELYKMCLKEAEERYEKTGLEAYRILIERFKKKIKEEGEDEVGME